MNVARIGIGIFMIVGAIGISDYNLFRWILLLALGLHIITHFINKESYHNAYLYGLIIILILFNPIFPIYLYNRSLWILLDISAAIFLFLGPLFTVHKVSSSSSSYNKMPEWYYYPEEQRSEYLNQILRFDSLVDEYNNMPDYKEIISDALVKVNIPNINDDFQSDLKAIDYDKEYFIKAIEKMHSEYEKVVEEKVFAGVLNERTAINYIMHSRNFVHWCKGNYIPGEKGKESYKFQR